jgi:hypothetical protein
VIAPEVVPNSRNIATRRFASRSRTYAAAAPLDVAITEMIDAPMASRMSMCNSSVSAGTTIIPPPSPSSDPRNPAPNEMAATTRTKISGVIARGFRSRPQSSH